MSSHVWKDERARLDGDLRGVTELDNDTGCWIDEVAAAGATEERLGEELFGLEAGPNVELLHQPAATPRASELSVLGFLDSSGWGKLVFVPFDGTSGDFWV